MPATNETGRRGPARGRALTLALAGLLCLIALLSSARMQVAHSQAPPGLVSPLPTSGAPFPSVVPTVVAAKPTGDIFYVSPEGTDAPPISPNLACASTSPCRTVSFAMAQARDGDSIALAGGTYPVTTPIEVNKLVTIAPNGQISGTTTTQQTASSSTQCTPLTASQFTCSTTLSSLPPTGVLAGSTVTLTVTAASGQTVTILQVFPVGTPSPCPATITPSATPSNVAVATIVCPAGRSIPNTTSYTVTVQVGVPGGGQPSAPTFSISVTGATTSVRAVLQSEGGPIFHVTAVGSLSQHATIGGLTIGNASAVGSNAAILLDNDAYTEIGFNVIGAEDLPNAVGILLTASDHPYIHDNIIQGSTLFPRTASVSVGTPEGGFGVVTDECLGSINHSNGVALANNLLAKNANAGVWLCSNGTGGFNINNNAIRANGRGIILSDAVDTTIAANIISDNVLDGIDVLQASERNQITSNTIESHQSPSSAGILMAGNGQFVPLGNVISSNVIHRNTVDIVIDGAQGTIISTNSITAVGTNTGILFTLAIPGWSGGQPLDTHLGGNSLEADGDCSATTGCAVRLTQGVTTRIDASSSPNAWGTTDLGQIQSEIWDNGRDPSLGVVYVQINPPPPTPFPGLGLPSTYTSAIACAQPAVATPQPPVAPPPPGAIAIPCPTPGAPPVVGPNTAPPVAPPPPGAVPLPSSTPTPSPSPGASPSPVPGASPTPAPSPTPLVTRPTSSTGGQAFTYLDPSSGYYVELALTVNSAGGAAVSDDLLTVSFYGQDGSPLGSTTVATDDDGSFSGDVQAGGAGRLTQPARVVVSDHTGASTPFTITPGTPLVREAPEEIQ